MLMSLLSCRTRLLPRLSTVLWDRPQLRAGVVSAWCKFHEQHQASSPSKAWAAVRGPVGAAYAHLIEMGASWTKAFTINIIDHPVDFLATPPPLQLQALLQEHARLHLDANLLEHLCAQHSWPAEAVMQTYRGGIDWDLLRRALNGKVGDLNAVEKRGLQLLVCHGYWSDARRWKAGYQGHSSCRACAWEEVTRHTLCKPAARPRKATACSVGLWGSLTRSAPKQWQTDTSHWLAWGCRRAQQNGNPCRPPRSKGTS